MVTQERLDEIEESALMRNIPVMQKEGIDWMIAFLREQKVTSLLEIGSAIGYSAMRLVTSIEGLKVETIEIDEERYQEACTYFKEYDLEDKIIIHHDDALNFDTSKRSIETYDALFIDAAKAQYQKFFEKYIPFIKKDGVVIVDNLDFHGMIYDIEHIKNRNTKQLVKKIKRFKDWIFNHEDYVAHYYPVGDGIVVIKRKDVK